MRVRLRSGVRRHRLRRLGSPARSAHGAGSRSRRRSGRCCACRSRRRSPSPGVPMRAFTPAARSPTGTSEPLPSPVRWLNARAARRRAGPGGRRPRPASTPGSRAVAALQLPGHRRPGRSAAPPRHPGLATPLDVDAMNAAAGLLSGSTTSPRTASAARVRPPSGGCCALALDRGTATACSRPRSRPTRSATRWCARWSARCWRWVRAGARRVAGAGAGGRRARSGGDRRPGSRPVPGGGQLPARTPNWPRGPRPPARVRVARGVAAGRLVGAGPSGKVAGRCRVCRCSST